jgi:hypothetical protein
VTEAVPEPATIALIGIGAVLWAGRRLRGHAYGREIARRRLRTGVALSMVSLASAATACAADFLGPSPYLAFDHSDAGTTVSPFKDIDFVYFHLEDFEDGLFNTPGVSIREFATTNIAVSTSDSVDGDDGVIDGLATGNTRSLFSNFFTSSFTFDFSTAALGTLPTHAGVVWTDVGRNFGGTPLAGDLVDNTLFEAFGPMGESLGVIGPFSLGDTSIFRTTPEDRFFGVINAAGISAIRISMPGKNNWEVDHLQYGSVTVPEPSLIILLAIGTLMTVAGRRRSGVARMRP